MNLEDREHLEKLYDVLVRRLRILELREAKMGDNTPPEVVIEIEDLKVKVREINNKLSISEPLIDHALSSMIKSGFLKQYSKTWTISIEQEPKDIDIPFIKYFYYSLLEVSPGEDIYFLFRVVDEGYNFAGDWKVELKGLETNFKPNRIGHGFYECTVNIPSDLAPSEYTITATVTDTNSKFTSINIPIIIKSIQ